MSAESRLLRRARAVDVLTFAAVVLVSPASVVFSYVVGVPPGAWLGFWLGYVVVFILLAAGVCVAGFGYATSLKVRADALAKKPSAQAQPQG